MDGILILLMRDDLPVLCMRIRDHGLEVACDMGDIITAIPLSTGFPPEA